MTARCRGPPIGTVSAPFRTPTGAEHVNPHVPTLRSGHGWANRGQPVPRIR